MGVLGNRTSPPGLGGVPGGMDRGTVKGGDGPG